MRYDFCNTLCFHYRKQITRIYPAKIDTGTTNVKISNASWRTYDRGTAHTWMRHDAHMIEAWRTMSESWQRWTKRRQTSRFRTSHVAHMNGSWCTHEWVMAHIWLRHGEHMSESWQRWTKRRQTSRTHAPKPGLMTVAPWDNLREIWFQCNSSSTLQQTATEWSTHTKTWTDDSSTVGQFDRNMIPMQLMEHTATHCIKDTYVRQ